MASSDYFSCEVCGGKTFYDAELHYEKGHLPVGAGAMIALCDRCAESHKLAVVPQPPKDGDKLSNERLDELIEEIKKRAGRRLGDPRYSVPFCCRDLYLLVVALREMRGAQGDPEVGPHTEVKIGLFVDAEGRWLAEGYDGANLPGDKSLEEVFKEALTDWDGYHELHEVRQFFIVTAHVPTPQRLVDGQVRASAEVRDDPK